MTIVFAIIILLLLIFVHETGHFLTAKLTGIRVNEFSLGMEPKIAGFVRGETKYSFRAIPIGGYCAMEGEDEDSEDPRAFGNKPARARALVLFAGSLMNVILAIVLLAMVIFSVGLPTRVISDVLEQAPVYEDGLRAGDELLSINGVSVNAWNDISQIINDIAAKNPGGDPQLTLDVMRDGSPVTIESHFYKDDSGNMKLGISPAMTRTPAFFFQSFGYGAQATFSMSEMMYEVIGQLVSGHAGISELTGPVGIVVTVGETMQYGFIYLVQLTALISLNLGIVNLLPFPALDGGRLVFLLIRKITGKAITNEIESRVHLVGILALFAFMAFITFQDIDRFFIK